MVRLGMADDPPFTDEEMALLARLGESARADSRPTLSTEEVRQSLKYLHEQTLRDRRKFA